MVTYTLNTDDKKAKGWAKKDHMFLISEKIAKGGVFLTNL